MSKNTMLDILKSNSQSLKEFDTDHAAYRTMQFTNYLLRKEKEFIANYKFEGDESFTRRTQRTFLKLMFRYGNAGILNPAKYVNDNLDKDSKEALEFLGLDLVDTISNEVLGDRIPVAVFPFHWNHLEKIIKGTGITISRHNTGKRNYNVTDKNTAIGSFDSWGYSGWYWWLLPAYITSSGDTAIKKRLSLMDIKLVQNSQNNTADSGKFDELFNIDRTKISLSPSQESFGFSKSSGKNKINIDALIAEKLSKLDMTNGESINDLMEFVKEHDAYLAKRMGVRINTQQNRNERSITKDFEADEVYWQRAEGELREQMEMFCEEYKNVFGKEIKVVTLEDKVKQELREEEKEKAGRIEFNKFEDNNKGDNKDETDNKETRN